MEPQKKDNDNQKSATNKSLERFSWVQKVRVDEHLYIRRNLQWEETFLNIVMFVHQISASSACWWTRTRNRKQLAERITTLKTSAIKKKVAESRSQLKFPKSMWISHARQRQVNTHTSLRTDFEFFGGKILSLPDGLIEHILWVLNLLKHELVRPAYYIALLDDKSLQDDGSQ